MNRHEGSGRPGGEAKIRYLDGDFQVIAPGAYVRCSVTGLTIPLAELRYWNVDLQEAYVDAAAAHVRFQELAQASSVPPRT